jgi:hypothetical protein
MESTIIHKTYKFRLKPNDDPKKQFAQIAGVCRLVWNLCLEQRIGVVRLLDETGTLKAS